MKKFTYIFFGMIIIMGLIFPATAFAEGENTSQVVNSNTNLENSETNTTSTLFSSTSSQTNTEQLAATNNGKISGYVWNDANKDGIFQSENEKPISGISVYLYNSGNAISSTTTLATGDFSFTGLAMSNYEIIISQNNFGSGSILSTKSNWNNTSKNNNFSKKSNDSSNWTSGIITLGNGETLTNFGCGVFDPTLLEPTTPEQTVANNTNPKTADETLYLIPILGLFGAIIMLIISKRKLNVM